MTDLNAYTKAQLIDIVERCRREIGAQRFLWILHDVDWKAADELDDKAEEFFKKSYAILGEALACTNNLKQIKLIAESEELMARANKLEAKADKLRQR